MLDSNLEKLIKLVKKTLEWSKIYWDRTHQLEENVYSQLDINEAFNNWNWAEKDLIDFIKEIEEHEKTTSSGK